MKMNVEDFLARCLSICQDQVHSFALNAAAAQSRRESLCHTKDVSGQFVLQVGQALRMQVGNHQEMSGVDGLNIHKGSALVILVDNA